ncbi:MAG: 4-hydroxythreonine-4-phosphate dehydrogenase PdxA [Candidatus Brocadiia bacterium]|jgi:4-hydroxythreonine-4-phosphate dehydrogenase
MSRKPLIGITIGDPSGIGPEVVLRALADRRVRAAARFMVFGSAAVLHRVARELDLHAVRLRGVTDEPIGRDAGPFLMECGECPGRLALLGRPTAAGGAASAAWIECAVQMALDRRIDAVVTAPISKEALHKAGYDWPGHTEMIAESAGVRKPVMMMAGGGLRVALVTTHAAIKDLPGLITRKNVLDTIRIVHRDLRRWFGLRKPRIAVCGLNPHAGEAGLFGREEAKSIAPAIRQARREGIACDGPIPADAAFTPKLRARHDAFVAMFHDQACIPVKMLAFDSGVNVTLGLPIIRTSPDHGTAYDIVRQGTADPGSMIAAILLAADMARRHG